MAQIRQKKLEKPSYCIKKKNILNLEESKHVFVYRYITQDFIFQNAPGGTGAKEAAPYLVKTESLSGSQPPWEEEEGEARTRRSQCTCSTSTSPKCTWIRWENIKIEEVFMVIMGK